MTTRKIITLTIQTTLTKIWFYSVVNWKSTISVSIRKGYFLEFELNHHLRGSVGEILKSVGTWTRPALEVLPDVISKWVSTIFVIGRVWASLWGHAVSPKQRAVRSPRGVGVKTNALLNTCRLCTGVWPGAQIIPALGSDLGEKMRWIWQNSRDGILGGETAGENGTMIQCYRFICCSSDSFPV